MNKKLRKQLKEELKQELTVKHINYDDTKNYKSVIDFTLIVPAKGEVSPEEVLNLPGSLLSKTIIPKFDEYNNVFHTKVEYSYAIDASCGVEDFEFTKYISKLPAFRNAVFLKRYNGWRTVYDCISKEANLLSDIYKNRYLYELDGKDWSGSLVDKYADIPDSLLTEIQEKGVSVHSYKRFDRLSEETETQNLITYEDFRDNYIVLTPEEHCIIEPIPGTGITRKSNYEKVMDELKEPHTLYHIKGSDKPPYFIINGHIVEADTDNWYEFILKKFFGGVVQPWMLEAVK